MYALRILAAAAIIGSSLTAANAQGAKQTIAAVRVDVNRLSTGYRATKITGSAIYNETNDKVGSIDDLIVNPDDRVPYAILSVGGFLGLGTRLIAVPFSELQFANDKIMLPGATKDALKDMPEFKYARS